MIETAQQRISTLENQVGPDATSPLFAQLAHYYLEENRAEDALRICDAGLAHFPFYTTGHLIKGKALVALRMRAEARREFEFVHDILPRNAAIAALLEQIPPGEDETLSATPQEVQPEVYQPTYTPPVQGEYTIPSTPQVRPELDYGFGGFDQPAQEPQPEPLPVPTSLSGPSFFDAITQTPAVSSIEDPFNFSGSSVEASTMPEPSSFGGFDVASPEAPSFSETQESAFADIPRTMPEPSSEFESPELMREVHVPSEEESFELYASRRRAELSGEDTISLEEYLENAEISLPQDLPTELPVSADSQIKIEDALRHEEHYTGEAIDLPQTQPTEFRMSLDVHNKIEDTFSHEEHFTDTPIVLPQVQPPELPMSSDIQNQIEEIANKLQSAKKITPVINLAQKETPPASEQDLPASMGFVTPTLAEIYAKQGWFDDAIKAYTALARNKPAEKERFEKRIEELEKLKSQSSK